MVFCSIGIVYFITFWYRVNERSLRIAFVVAHANLAGAFGGSIGYGMGKLNNRGGLEGFRWLFIIEGLITALCMLLVVFFLPDYPSTAKWLSDEDKKFAEDRLKVDGGGYSKAHSSKEEIRDTCLNPRMLAHYFTYVSSPTPSSRRLMLIFSHRSSTASPSAPSPSSPPPS